MKKYIFILLFAFGVLSCGNAEETNSNNIDQSNAEETNSNNIDQSNAEQIQSLKKQIEALSVSSAGSSDSAETIKDLQAKIAALENKTIDGSAVVSCKCSASSGYYYEYFEMGGTSLADAMAKAQKHCTEKIYPASNYNRVLLKDCQKKKI